MDLKEVVWKDFTIGQIFDIYATSSSIDKNKLVNTKGNFPYITRTDQNNGCDLFIGIQELKYKRDKANVITIGLDTQTVFYQKSEFYTGQNIQILDFDELNEYNAKFIITLLKAQMTKFNWGGNGATLTRLKKTKILLPATLEGNPDYAFMEYYIKKKEKELFENYKLYLSANPEELQRNRVKETIQKEWKEFEIGKLFQISSGKSKGLNHLVSKANGGINYLGATNSNNGVLAYVEEVKSMIHEGNAICFIRNGEGSMGYSIYKAESFIATSDISVGYSEHLNKEIGLFITELSEAFAEKKFKDFLDTDQVFIQPAFTLPETIAPGETAKDITKSLYEKEAKMNSFEERVINDIGNMPNIAFWTRNIERRGFRINGFVNHYPDFIIQTKSRKTVVLETKGDHLDAEQKIRLGNLWAGKAGNSYRYFMVYERRVVDCAYKLEDFINIIKAM